MGDVDGGGEIERARQLRRDTNHVRRRRQLLIPNDDIEGVGRNEIHREIRGHIADPGRERRGNAGVAQIGGDQSLQLDDELVGTLGRKIDAKQLDRDETILFRLIGAKDRAKSSCADLVKHAKRSESVGRRIAGSVRVQRVLLEGRRSDRNTETHLVQSFRRATVRFSWVRTRSNLLFNQTPRASQRLGSQSTSGASRGRGVSRRTTPTIFLRWRRFSAVIRPIARHGRIQFAARKRIRVIAARWRRFSRASRSERGAPARAREAARQLADPRAVALVTGQQAGLFGGPLFTLHKALTALKLAEKVSREHNVPVVAVFWIDAEDHDWNEVRSCTVFDEALGTHSISLPARSASADPTPVATVKLDRSISTALDELESVLAPTEFRAGLMADLREAYSPGMGMASAFGRWLERVLGPRGLVVYDSSDPATKPLAADVFIRELTSPGETSKLAATTGADLVARGYHVQVQPQDEAVAVFHLDGGRRPIRQQDGQFVIGERRYAPSDLIQEARTAPAAFSPNVLLRPVVQDTLFPTICYVAGPNELAYLGQLRQIYDRFGVQMPLMYPRASATLVDSGALRFLQKYKLPLEALQPQDESSLNQLLEAQIPTSVEDSFSGVAHAIETTMGRLVQTIPALDPTLQGAAQSTLGRMQHDLSRSTTRSFKPRSGGTRRSGVSTHAPERSRSRKAMRRSAPSVSSPSSTSTGRPSSIGSTRSSRSILGITGLSASKSKRPRLTIRVAAIWRKKWVRIAAVVVGIPSVLLVIAATYYYVQFARLLDAQLNGEHTRVLPRIFARPFELRVGESLSATAAGRSIERSGIRGARHHRQSRRVHD